MIVYDSRGNVVTHRLKYTVVGEDGVWIEQTYKRSRAMDVVDLYRQFGRTVFVVDQSGAMLAARGQR